MTNLFFLCSCFLTCTQWDRGKLPSTSPICVLRGHILQYIIIIPDTEACYAHCMIYHCKKCGVTERPREQCFPVSMVIDGLPWKHENIAPLGCSNTSHFLQCNYAHYT